MKHQRRTRRRQRGAALLTAMIIVTLVVTLSSAMVWQQWRAVQVEAAERARAQSAWILSGALDWARLILKEDARTAGVDHLGEPWAVPLAEARLSTFLAADKNNADDGPDAFLSGSIADAQARYNLNNVVLQGKLVPGEVAVLERICQSAGVGVEVAGRIANGLLEANGVAGAAPSPAAPLLPRSVSQLGWLGIDPKAVEQLTPYVTLLPTVTPVNVNTASREVLAAVLPGADLASAERIVQVRQRTPFKSLQELSTLVPTLGTVTAQQASVNSRYFEVRGRLRADDRMLEERSLVERRGLDVIALQRERISSREQTPTR
jgi:general secretion pathway protein K